MFGANQKETERGESGSGLSGDSCNNLGWSKAGLRIPRWEWEGGEGLRDSRDRINLT